jgi:hypothetical protein
LDLNDGPLKVTKLKVLHENNVEVDRRENWNFPSLLRIKYEARFCDLI